MPLRTVRYVFGFTILLAHVATIAAFLILGSRRYDDITEVLSQAMVVAPLFAVYLVLFITYAATYPTGTAPDETNNGAKVMIGAPALFAQGLIVALFAASMILVPVVIFSQNDGGYDLASKVVGYVETLFAAYMGIIFRRLFPFAT